MVMGVCVEQWRAVISGWRDSGGQNTTNRRSDVAGSRGLQLQVMPLLLLAALLTISGVETNPGPRTGMTETPAPLPLVPEDAKLKLTPVVVTELKQKIKELEEENEDLKAGSTTEFEPKYEQSKKAFVIKSILEDQVRHKLEWEERIKKEVREKLEVQKKIQKQEEEYQKLEQKNEALAREIREREQQYLGMEQIQQTESDAPYDSASAIPPQDAGLKKYKTTTGRATMEGQRFEVKMLSLIFMRAINNNQPFFLATNMAAAGAFDDIIIRTKLPGQDKWSTTLIQLKHKENLKVGRSHLLSLKGNDFGLVKYCESYEKVRTEYGLPDNDWIASGEFDDFLFILYTNSLPLEELNEYESFVNVAMNNMFSSNSAGSVLHFTASSSIHSHMQEVAQFKQLLADLKKEIAHYSSDKVVDTIKNSLSNFQIADENKELESKRTKLINDPSRDKLKSTLNDKDLSLVQDTSTYGKFFEKFYLFTNQTKEAHLDSLISQEIKKACHVSDDSHILSLKTLLLDYVYDWWNDKEPSCSWLTEESDVWTSIMSSRIAQLSLPKVLEIEKGVIKFKSLKNGRLFMTLKESPRVNVAVEEGTRSLMTSQVYHAMIQNQTKNIIFTGTKELLKRKEDMMGVWQNSLCQGLVIDCDQALSEEEKDAIATPMLNAMRLQGHLAVIIISNKKHSLARALHPKCFQYKAVCQWSDLSSDSQNELLKRPVTFQGHRLPLSSLVGDDPTEISQQLQGKGLVMVMNSDIKVGKDLEKLTDHFLPRTLIRDNKRVPIASLADVPDRVVVLIAEPGMGKTTLVTYLAQAAKLADPSIWIVRVNLNDCTDYLSKLNEDNIKTSTAIEFLTRFAFTTPSASAVEEIIFKNRLLDSGKITVFVDSVDEVCPFYKDVVCSLLKHLLETKIQTLWVTSRNVAKESLEVSMNVRSLALLSFSREDQLCFFKLFWKDKLVNATVPLHVFVNKMMDLYLRGFKGGDPTSAIPQQTRMLAEYFDTYLDQYLKTGSLQQLPKRINIYKLFESFVKKKLRIYSEEKRKDDKTNAAIKTDKKVLKRHILETHMHAGLSVLLSSEELSEVVSENVLRKHVMDQGIEKAGIIDKVVDQKPYFIHRTFAEYFTALWIAENFKTSRNFIQHTIFEPRFQVVRTFLDLKLSEDCEVREAIMNRDYKEAFDLLSMSRQNLRSNVKRADAGRRTPLHLLAAYSADNNPASANIKQHIVQTLASSINVQDKLLEWRPLQYAARVGSWSLASVLLSVGGKEKDLEEAEKIVKKEVFNELIKFLTAPSSSPVLLMLESCRHGDLGVVRYLVEERQLDISNCLGRNNVSPMHRSAEGGHVDVMRFLSERNASCDVVDDNDSRPLHYAASVHAAEFLIQNGAAVKACDKHGYSPLALAFRTANVPLTKCLLSHGADLHAVKSDVDTPLWRALKAGSLDVDEYFSQLQNITLRHQGQEIHSMDRAERKYQVETSPYEQHEHGRQDEQVQNHVYIEPTEQLPNSFAYVPHGEQNGVVKNNRKDARSGSYVFAKRQSYNDEKKSGKSKGTNLLMKAVEENRLEDMKILLERGLKLSERTGFYLFKEGESLLHLATRSGAEDVVRYLIDRESELKLTKSDYKSLLFMGCEFGNVDVIEYLHSLGVDLSLRDRTWGSSPLHIASEWGQIDAVKYLHSLGADPQAINNRGERPVDVACTWRHSAKRQELFSYLNPYS